MNDPQKHLDAFRTLSIPGMPDFGVRLVETLKAMNQQRLNIAQQTNSDPSANPSPPPPLGGITVTSTSVGHHISIQHPGDFYRGVEYHGDYADNPQFSNPFPWHAGPARELDLATGSRTLYFRAQGQYPTGSSTDPVYHGGLQPIAVTGGTQSPLGASQGSGTGLPGEGLSGYGPVSFRSVTGAPPVRKS